MDFRANYLNISLPVSGNVPASGRSILPVSGSINFMDKSRLSLLFDGSMKNIPQKKACGMFLDPMVPAEDAMA
jgi:hypothetical protein